MRFSKAKYKVLHLVQSNPMLKYREYMERSSEEKAFRMLVQQELNLSWQWVLAAQRAKHILSCIKNGMVSGLKEVILPLWSAFVTSCLEYCVQLCDLQ